MTRTEQRQIILPRATHPCLHKFQTKTESKNICQQQTHLGRAIYAPKMEDACKSKIPAVHRRNGGRQGGLGGNVQVSFLATSWETPRSSIKKAIRSARGLPRSMSVWLRTKQIFCSLRRRTLTLCLRHARAGNLCLFFALPQRIGEEKASRGKPLETPSARENCRRSAPPMFSRNQANSDFALAI